MNSPYYPDESVYYNPWNLDKSNQLQQQMNSSVYAYAMHNLCSSGMAAGSRSGLNYSGTRMPAGVTVCNNSSQEEAIAELKYMLDTLEHQQHMTDMGAYYSAATQATNSLISQPNFHRCVHPIFHPQFHQNFRPNLRPSCQSSTCSTHASMNSEGSAHTVLDNTQDLGESLTEDTKAEGKEATEDTTPQGERDNQIKTLTDLIRQTMRKLDNYMTLQSVQQQQQQQRQQQAQGSQLNMNPYLDLPRMTQYMESSLPMTLVNSLQQPAKTRGKRLVKVMPVQPLVIMPTQTATAPVATPAPAAPVEPPAKYRVRVRRKRLSSAKSTSKSQVAESCPASSSQVGKLLDQPTFGFFNKCPFPLFSRGAWAKYARQQHHHVVSQGLLQALLWRGYGEQDKITQATGASTSTSTGCSATHTHTAVHDGDATEPNRWEQLSSTYGARASTSVQETVTKAAAEQT